MLLTLLPPPKTTPLLQQHPSNNNKLLRFLYKFCTILLSCAQHDLPECQRVFFLLKYLQAQNSQPIPFFYFFAGKKISTNIDPLLFFFSHLIFAKRWNFPPFYFSKDFRSNPIIRFYYNVKKMGESAAYYVIFLQCCCHCFLYLLLLLLPAAALKCSAEELLAMLLRKKRLYTPIAYFKRICPMKNLEHIIKRVCLYFILGVRTHIKANRRDVHFIIIWSCWCWSCTVLLVFECKVSSRGAERQKGLMLTPLVQKIWDKSFW